MHILKSPICVSWSNRDALGDMHIHIFCVYKYLQLMHCSYLLVAPEAHKNTFFFFSSRMLLYWILLLAQKYSEFLQDTLRTSMPALSFAKIHSPALSLLALQSPGCSCLQQISVLWLLCHIICSKVYLELNQKQQKQQQKPPPPPVENPNNNQKKSTPKPPKEILRLNGLIKFVLEIFPRTLSQGFTSQTGLQPKRSLWFAPLNLHC